MNGWIGIYQQMRIFLKFKSDLEFPIQNDSFQVTADVYHQRLVFNFHTSSRKGEATTYNSFLQQINTIIIFIS